MRQNDAHEGDSCENRRKVVRQVDAQWCPILNVYLMYMTFKLIMNTLSTSETTYEVQAIGMIGNACTDSIYYFIDQ